MPDTAITDSSGNPKLAVWSLTHAELGQSSLTVGPLGQGWLVGVTLPAMHSPASHQALPQVQSDLDCLHWSLVGSRADLPSSWIPRPASPPESRPESHQAVERGQGLVRWGGGG